MKNTISKIISIQIGKIKTIPDETFKKKQWTTGSYKESVNGKVSITTLGIIGDEVSDTIHHGGVHKAIFANSYENYPSWCKYLQKDTLAFGALAENLTVSNIKEEDVYIGDIHQIGEVILEVTQPREPCWKISKKHDNKTFTKHIYITGRTGWYYRVIQEGKIQAGEDIVLLKRISNSVNILEANLALHHPKEYSSTVEYLLALEVLGEPFKKSLKKKVEVTNEN